MKRSYWYRTRRLTLILLLLWLLITFVVNWFAAELNRFSFLGFPLGFYMAAQGELILFLLLIAFYNWRMRRIESDCGIRDE